MSALRNLVTCALFLTALLTTHPALAVTHTFQVEIPRKVAAGATPGAGGPCETTWVKFTFSFATDPGVTITGTTVQITEPDKENNGSAPETWPSTPQALTPGMTQVSHLYQTPPSFGGITPLDGDTVYVFAPDKSNLSGYDISSYQRYEIDFALTSNYDLTGKSYQQNNPDIYTVTVNVTTSDAAHPATLSGQCIESYDPLNRSVSGSACNSTSLYFVPITDPLQTVLIADGATQATNQCFTHRKPVDAFLVLDKSGSMASSTTGSDPEAKIVALQEAVHDFVTAWDDTRHFVDASAPPNDQIGTVLFDSAAVPWTDGGLTSGLNTFAGADAKIIANVNPATCTATSCGQLVPGASTSIGKGLLLADSGFPNDGNRHVMLLMSDGIQNTDPIVRAFDPSAPTNCTPTTPTAVATYTGGICSAASILANEIGSAYQIHAVTVGTGVAVSAAINQAIAQASGGFYINTEDNANELKPFFLELLQNVLKFNSYDTIRMISKSGATAILPFSTSTVVSTTTQNVEFSVMWPSGHGVLRLTVSPPGGAQPIVKESDTGFLSIAQQLPLAPPFDPTGSWNIIVEAVRATDASVNDSKNVPFPFDVYVMADDGAIKSDLSIVPADYKTGDNIRLRAKLSKLGSPILGLGSHPGDKIEADLIKPGESVGDILSDSSASSVSAGPDPQSPAEAKLANTLKENPSVLTHASDTVQLYDDGKAEHGDDIAGDGIYSALYPAVLSGHYNFLFSIEDADPSSVRFTRQQLRTAFVRAIPDATNTVLQSSVIQLDKGRALSIVMTPRAKPGPNCTLNNPKCGRMGPGWANYFWFTTPGQTPLKPKDNLDGTYAVVVPFTGSTPPPVSVHFENVVAMIGDSVPPDKLPDPLGSGNVLTVCCNQYRFAAFLDFGANVPNGAFGTLYNKSFSFNAGLEYMLNSHLSAEGIFGYHRFPAKAGADENLYQFSVDLKAYLLPGVVRPFVNAGIGGYKYDPGSTFVGGNFGGGVLYAITPRIGLQGSYNFHVINGFPPVASPPSTSKFSTVQVGLRFVF